MSDPATRANGTVPPPRHSTSANFCSLNGARVSLPAYRAAGEAADHGALQQDHRQRDDHRVVAFDDLLTEYPNLG